MNEEAKDRLTYGMQQVTLSICVHLCACAYLSIFFKNIEIQAS